MNNFCSARHNFGNTRYWVQFIERSVQLHKTYYGKNQKKAGGTQVYDTLAIPIYLKRPFPVLF